MTARTETPPLTAAQRQLILDAQGWLRRASRHLVVRYRGLLSRDDVLQTMQLGLAEAARNFDPTRDASFLAFAWPGVTGAVVRAATKEIDARAPLRRVVGACAGLEVGKVGFDEGDASIGRRAEEMTAKVGAAWALGSATTDGEQGREGAELRRLVEAAIAALPERSRRVVEAHYFEGRSQRVVAEELGVGYATVRRDNEEALAAIRKACEKGGY